MICQDCLKKMRQRGLLRRNAFLQIPGRAIGQGNLTPVNSVSLTSDKPQNQRKWVHQLHRLFDIALCELVERGDQVVTKLGVYQPYSRASGSPFQYYILQIIGTNRNKTIHTKRKLCNSKDLYTVTHHPTHLPRITSNLEGFQNYRNTWQRRPIAASGAANGCCQKNHTSYCLVHHPSKYR